MPSLWVVQGPGRGGKTADGLKALPYVSICMESPCTSQAGTSGWE